MVGDLTCTYRHGRHLCRVLGCSGRTSPRPFSPPPPPPPAMHMGATSHNTWQKNPARARARRHDPTNDDALAPKSSTRPFFPGIPGWPARMALSSLPKAVGPFGRSAEGPSSDLHNPAAVVKKRPALMRPADQRRGSTTTPTALTTHLLLVDLGRPKGLSKATHRKGTGSWHISPCNKERRAGLTAEKPIGPKPSGIRAWLARCQPHRVVLVEDGIPPRFADPGSFEGRRRAGRQRARGQRRPYEGKKSKPSRSRCLRTAFPILPRPSKVTRPLPFQMA